MKNERRINKAEEARKLYFAMMGEEECCPGVDEHLSRQQLLEHYDESLWIYQDMLKRAIETSDRDEIKSLRRSVQEIKEAKRSLLAS